MSDQPAPGWYPDPSGEHELRYWDGNAWTDQTRDNGKVINSSRSKRWRRLYRLGLLTYLAVMVLIGLEESQPWLRNVFGVLLLGATAAIPVGLIGVLLTDPRRGKRIAAVAWLVGYVLVLFTIVVLALGQ